MLARTANLALTGTECNAFESFVGLVSRGISCIRVFNVELLPVADMLIKGSSNQRRAEGAARGIERRTIDGVYRSHREQSLERFQSNN
jgi:hypothetical protein